MKQLIACCGIDCECCDAYIATIENDTIRREETAQKWSEMFGATIPAEAIDCAGCRTEGVKFSHCADCEIRKCVIEKGFDTCGDCEELDTCQTISQILQNVPGVKENLCS